MLRGKVCCCYEFFTFVCWLLKLLNDWTFIEKSARLLLSFNVWKWLLFVYFDPIYMFIIWFIHFLQHPLWSIMSIDVSSADIFFVYDVLLGQCYIHSCDKRNYLTWHYKKEYNWCCSKPRVPGTYYVAMEIKSWLNKCGIMRMEGWQFSTFERSALYKQIILMYYHALAGLGK